MYPLIYYRHEATGSFEENFSKDFLLNFILFNVPKTKADAEISFEDLPFYEEFVANEVYEGGYSAGYVLEFDVDTILGNREKYDDMLTVLNDDGFVLKVQYNMLREYLEQLNAEIQSRQDSFSDLLLQK